MARDGEPNGTDDGVTLTELAEQTGESARTLRFYVMQGLLRCRPSFPMPVSGDGLVLQGLLHGRPLFRIAASRASLDSPLRA
jgi:hypothetical protein